MEQDPPVIAGNDELPTYDDLAAQNGPNSRFGRWKEWVEKRAAERYAEDTPERRQARRMRGWGPHVNTQVHEPLPPSTPIPAPSQVSPPSSSGATQTVLSSSSTRNSSSFDSDPNSASSASYTTQGMALAPSHLKLHSFGSRFLPHSELPILTLLPLFNDTKLLIGHMNGLSVLDMDPDVSSSELSSKEPRRRDIWHGVGVYQLALLEYGERSASSTPQGVILALVGAEPPEGGSEKDSKELHKVIRMYNLASLASITSWATAGKDHEPLNLNHLDTLEPGHKKHKPRGLKLKAASMDASSQSFPLVHPYDLEIPPTPPPKDPPRSSLGASASLTPAFMPVTVKAKAQHRPVSPNPDWEILGHDLPLRWATDYVPLASSHSKLATHSVLFFELHRCTDGRRITARLAVATKQNILLYESVSGERAFRFVKEFYTPIPARSAKFVYQSGHEASTKSHGAPASLAPPQFATYSGFGRQHVRRASSPEVSATWAACSSLDDEGQLSLFVVFEKKAGLIRLSDSSVGEVELWEASGVSPISSLRRSFTPLEGLTNKDWKGQWAPPAETILPLTPVMPLNISSATETTRVYFLTRGKRTHILPFPLAMPLGSQAPLKILEWGVHPTQVVPRACERPATAEPFLQVTALSEEGVEVQEFPLTFLASPKGKGRERDDTVVAEAEVGPGGAGFLCMGGHWTEQDARRALSPTWSPLRRQLSVSTVDMKENRTREQGFYAWTRKGYDDWRVFWLGGDSHDQVPPASP